ncbi:MAG TPA: hypothetical protein VIG33_16490, partial [Pseudobdellovibrionaceae bacterium]
IGIWRDSQNKTGPDTGVSYSITTMVSVKWRARRLRVGYPPPEAVQSNQMFLAQATTKNVVKY